MIGHTHCSLKSANKLQMRLSFITILTFVSTLTISAQTLNTTTTPSRCQNSGTITVSITSGVPSYTYSITAGPSGTSAPVYPIVITSGSASETFSSLIPGTYTISVNDANGTYTTTETVLGNYTEPRFTLTSEDVICGGASDGMLIATNQVDGRNPYTYQIVSPVAHTSTIQSSDTFTGLPAGTYQVRMYDSCGNFQTRTATISDNYQPVDIWSGNTDQRINCDSASLFMKPHRGRAPYIIRVVDPTNSSNFIDSMVINDNGYYPFDLPIYYPGMSTTFSTNYRFEITDACGQTDYRYNRFNIYNSARSTATCDGFTFTYGTNQTTSALMGDTLWLTLSPDPLGISPMPFQVINGTTIALDSIPYGNYTYSIQTDCETITGSINESRIPFDSIYTRVIPESCSEDMARLRIEPYNRPDGSYTTQLWKGSTLINTRTHGPAGILEYNIESDSVIYDIVMWNDCNDTVKRSVLVDTTVNITLFTNTSVFCGGGGNVHIGSRIENSTTTGRFFRLHNLAGTQIERTLTSSDTANWNNIAPGTYVASVLYGGYGQLNASYCESTKDTIVILGYEFPTVDAVSTQCTNGNLSTEVTEVTGTGPFTYYLRDQATLTTLRGPSLNDTFENLSSGTAYNILVVDSCGNSANANISPRVVDTTLAIIGNAVCENAPLTIYTDTFISTTYAWTGPNGFLSTDNQIDFTPVSLNDSGEYILTANVLNGCIIYRDTFDLNVNPITTADANEITVATCYTASGSGYGVYDSAIAIVNANSPSTIESTSWEIISTPSGASYQMRDSTAVPLYIKLNAPGTYDAVFRIESTNGCHTDDTVEIISNCFAYLPVDLLSFSAEEDKSKVKLNFVTASEKNNEGFRILRSTNGIDWRELGFVEGQGNSNSKHFYSFYDNQPAIGSNYYRLAQVDYDGSVSESEIKEITISRKFEFNAFPNPTTNSITVYSTFLTQKSSSLVLSNIHGTRLKELKSHNSAKTTIDLAEYPKGIYFITLRTKSTHKTLRIIKQ